MPDLTDTEIELLLQALNDREGVLSTDWEAASRANSTALTERLRNELINVRALAHKLIAAQAPLFTAKVKFATGNGVLTGHIVDEFELGGETFHCIKCQFGETRALCAGEFTRV